MLVKGPAALMRIYTSERAKAGISPLHEVVVERAHAVPIAGVTVQRAVAGYGERGDMQRASLLDLSGNLPLVIELVDEEAKLRAFLREIEEVGDLGLVTLQPLEVLHYGHGGH